MNILKMRTDVTSADSVYDWIITTLNSRDRSSYVCVSNVHMCMEVFDSSYFSKVVNSADLVIPDGRPIFWAQKLLKAKWARQVRGQDVMNLICSRSVTDTIRIGLYGGSSDEILDRVKYNLNILYPNINVVYSYSPPFRSLSDLEAQGVVDNINQTRVDVLFVGIGCPKQEQWMFEHKGKINCVMLGVGAAFDFISGSKKHAPRWMQKAGLEWLFRLFSEPKRLWKRYLKQNPRFIYYFLQQWLLKKDFTKEGPKNV